ncbi:phosphatase PAP2 family protein [uncultured Roseibium sp.]|uniref:phosphatase PAP2 family protein n=1 Tax=uncultured Roseibium sp. TaxID=1936171 RepID=UPI00261A3E44|nr:phosphatase PAP2 family protein [uncultured Roseibium sp.]
MLTTTEILLATTISIGLILLGYQVYFLPQKKPLRNVVVGRVSYFDERIPFVPWWVWIYSGLYYPFIISPILAISSMTEFYVICFSYYLLLFFHVVISYFFPRKTPTEWRNYEVKSAASRMLKFVQSIDKGGNCYPSMHVAVAFLAGWHWFYYYPELSWTTYTIAGVLAIISLSTLFTKQHFVADIIPGACLGTFAFLIYKFALYDHLFNYAVTLRHWFV